MQFKEKVLYDSFPRQRLPEKKKTPKWRAKCVNWGADRDVLHFSPVRKSVEHKQINYDLLNGKLHMSDLKMVVNPHNMTAGYIPDNIQHYPIINSKLRVLHGEESKRVFDYSVVITNPTAITEIQEAKKAEILTKMQELIANPNITEEQYAAEMEKLQYYANFEYKDFREIRANSYIKHFSKEQNFNLIFNNGFMDAMTVGEEIYQVCVIQGEPTLIKLNPRKVRVYQSGYSNKIEDADMIVIEDYWSFGKVVDTYQDVLTTADLDYIEKLCNHTGDASYYSSDNSQAIYGLAGKTSAPSDIYVLRENEEGFYWENKGLTASDIFGGEETIYSTSTLPYDFYGNIKVCQVYWKSLRKVKKVKSYDPLTGEEMFTLHTEHYITNKDKGEEEEILWINEAWQGVKIGDRIFVNMGPCPIQFNTMSNPSKCHFGIIGSVYNINDDQPFSMVDIMKPYNYLYDVIYDNLIKLIARNHGKIIRLDFAKIPEKWGIDKWLTVLKTAGVAVEDSFQEGKRGQSLGKLAGALNNASSGVIDAELGQSIQSLIALLEFIKNEMAEVAGISKQREGQISNRETVGGVERATLQSSHITEWLFIVHDDVKKRVIEAFVEVAKAASRGRTIKFQYIAPDHSQRVMEIDGDSFAESDYGLVVDNSPETQELKANLPGLVQAGLSSKMTSFATAMKIWSATSVAEKQRMIENDERAMQQQAAQAQQAQQQAEQQKIEQELRIKTMELEHEDMLNKRDNETKIVIANIQASSKAQSVQEPITPTESPIDRDRLNEQKREFDERLKLDREKLAHDKEKAKTDARLKEKQINKRTTKQS